MNTRVITEPAVRGRILDRNGVPLADNSSEAVVTVQRKVLLESEDGGRGLVRAVAGVLGLPFEQVWGRTQACGAAGAPPAPVCFNGSPYQPIPVAAGVDPTRALSLLERPDDFPGVGVLARPVRDYPAAGQAGAAHVLGYLARASAAGRRRPARASWPTPTWWGAPVWSSSTTAVLRGTPGRTTVAIDPRGVVTGTLSRTHPCRVGTS